MPCAGCLAPLLQYALVSGSGPCEGVVQSWRLPRVCVLNG